MIVVKALEIATALMEAWFESVSRQGLNIEYKKSDR